MQLPSQQVKADLIRFWCMRAAAGRQHSRAASKVGFRKAASALVQLIAYGLIRHDSADILLVAHADRGASALVDIPYVGRLADHLARHNNVLLLQMQPLDPSRNVQAYPWLGMRIVEQLQAMIWRRVDAADAALANQLAAQYSISPRDVARRITRLNFELRQWHLILNSNRPRLVLLVDGYSANAALIWQARQMGIKTAEVQHGACGPSHSGYVMIGESPQRLAPDYFLAWNLFWRDRMAQVPGYRAKAKVCALTAQELDGRVERGQVKEILLIHQPSLSKELHDLLVLLPNRVDRSPIAVKYHPGIQADWELRIGQLCADKGIEVVRDRPIEAVVGDYRLIVGWFSTVLHQAADAGYEVRVLREAGYEMQQEPLLSRGLPEMSQAEFLAMGSI